MKLCYFLQVTCFVLRNENADLLCSGSIWAQQPEDGEVALLERILQVEALEVRINGITQSLNDNLLIIGLHRSVVQKCELLPKVVNRSLNLSNLLRCFDERRLIYIGDIRRRNTPHLMEMSMVDSC